MVRPSFDHPPGVLQYRDPRACRAEGLVYAHRAAAMRSFSRGGGRNEHQRPAAFAAAVQSAAQRAGESESHETDDPPTYLCCRPFHQYHGPQAASRFQVGAGRTFVRMRSMLLANMALPSFMGHWIVFSILLPLVATVEAVVLARLLGIKPIESFVTSAKANWRSTISGLPVGWCMALAGLVPAGILAYFLPAPYRDPAFQIIAFTALTGGFIPTKFSGIAMAAACLILLVPYYVATVRVERKVVEARHPEIDPTRVAIAVRWANRLTYSVLAILVLWWLMAAIVDYRKQAENSDRRPRAESSGAVPLSQRTTEVTPRRATFHTANIDVQTRAALARLGGYLHGGAWNPTHLPGGRIGVH